MELEIVGRDTDQCVEEFAGLKSGVVVVGICGGAVVGCYN